MRVIICVSQTHQHSSLNGYTVDVERFNQRTVVINIDDQEIHLGFSEIMVIDFGKEYQSAHEKNDIEYIHMLNGYAIVNFIKITPIIIP